MTRAATSADDAQRCVSSRAGVEFILFQVTSEGHSVGQLAGQGGWELVSVVQRGFGDLVNPTSAIPLAWPTPMDVFR